jgi:hypothetical protein
MTAHLAEHDAHCVPWHRALKPPPPLLPLRVGLERVHGFDDLERGVREEIDYIRVERCSSVLGELRGRPEMLLVDDRLNFSKEERRHSLDEWVEGVVRAKQVEKGVFDFGPCPVEDLEMGSESFGSIDVESAGKMPDFAPDEAES